MQKLKIEEVLKYLFEHIAPSYVDEAWRLYKSYKTFIQERGDAAPLSAIELVGLDVPFKPVEDEASDLEKDQPEES